MQEIIGDIFTLGIGHDKAVVITTNGQCKNNGCAVMGAGIALTARESFDFYNTRSGKYERIDEVLGRFLRMCPGNHAQYLGLFRYKKSSVVINIMTMPTKHDWRMPSEISLIKRSAEELVEQADLFGLRQIYMPRPGCTNGRLDWECVKNVIAPILDDRFVVCTPPQR